MDGEEKVGKRGERYSFGLWGATRREFLRRDMCQISTHMFCMELVSSDWFAYDCRSAQVIQYNILRN